jgi:hypothetical protein
MIFEDSTRMEISLNDTQIALIKQRQAGMNACQLEFNHAQDKLNSLIMGIVTAKGVIGQFNFQIQGDKLILEFPSVPVVEE